MNRTRREKETKSIHSIQQFNAFAASNNNNNNEAPITRFKWKKKERKNVKWSNINYFLHRAFCFSFSLRQFSVFHSFLSVCLGFSHYRHSRQRLTFAAQPTTLRFIFFFVRLFFSTCCGHCAMSMPHVYSFRFSLRGDIMLITIIFLCAEMPRKNTIMFVYISWAWFLFLVHFPGLSPLTVILC